MTWVGQRVARKEDLPLLAESLLEPPPAQKEMAELVRQRTARRDAAAAPRRA